MNPFLQHTQYIRLSFDPQRTSSALVLSGHNTVVVQERPIVDDQNHLMTRDSHILDNQDDILTRDEPVVGRQPDVMYQGEPLAFNQSQNIEDPSTQMQVKYAMNPCRRKKEFSVRGGDSVTFVEDTDVQKSDPYIKLVAGGSSFPVGKRANDVPDCTSSKPHRTVEDPSHCVWAIISCCSPGSNEVRHRCFELLGCPGPFWDTNPCNKGMTASAVKVVDQFYSSGKRE
jgi:uncharacterized protein affecting Mg2+/Co2+ transport